MANRPRSRGRGALSASASARARAAASARAGLPVLGVILAAAAALRAVGIQYGLPFGTLLNPDEQSIVVVSSDRELVASVRALGANTVGAAPFLAIIR